MRGEHLVWHQELVCPGEMCRGRVRWFPPGVLSHDGREERRHCPQCGTAVTTPAFYLDGGLRGQRGLRPSGAEVSGAPRPRNSTESSPLPRRPAAGPAMGRAQSITVSEAVTGARVVTVTGPPYPELLDRLSRGIAALMRLSARPLVIDLRGAQGDELAIFAAVREAASTVAQPHPERGPARATCAGERSAGPDRRTVVRFVIDTTRLDAWAAIDHRVFEVFPTLHAALEPKS